jgi:hypothetical protein
MTFFPNRENVYPIAAAAVSDCVEASIIWGKLKDGPAEGCFMKIDIAVTVAATPRATATFAKKEAPGLLDPTSTASMISLRLPSPAEDSSPDVAFAVHEPKLGNLRKLLLFAGKNYQTSNATNLPQKNPPSHLSVTNRAQNVQNMTI